MVKEVLGLNEKKKKTKTRQRFTEGRGQLKSSCTKNGNWQLF